MKDTTDLMALKNGAAFTWGSITKIMEIGEYAIAEYHPYVYKDGRGTSEYNQDKLEYHCWSNGEDMSISADTLDAALAECIARKYDGSNSRAARYFMAMIGADK